MNLYLSFFGGCTKAIISVNLKSAVTKASKYEPIINKTFKDFGLQSMENQMREALLNIIQDRFNIASTIIVLQIPVSKWYEIIGEATIADAILDRLVHSSHRINLNGESYRKNLFDIDQN